MSMDPDIQLDPYEARLLGVLVEKALTTPEQYPLTLHAAAAGANQKVNRDPVLALTDDEVGAALEGLIDRELARKVFPGNSRVDKYCHTGTSTLKVEINQLAILAELLLRGPETAAELRARVSRMVPIESPEHLAGLLDSLRARGLVERLPPGRGERAERYAQRLCPGLHREDDTGDAASATADAGARPLGGLSGRVEALEAEVERLRRQLRSLADKLGEALDE